MKRILFFIVSVIIFSVSVTLFADEKKLTTEQLVLRSEIFKFLKEEGFMPEIDSDGDIAFKSEGLSYYVAVSPKDESPMYVSLFLPYDYPDNYPMETVVRASKELNKYKGVKVLCFDKSYSIRSELYLRDAELFKESFFKVLSQIKSVDSEFLDECKNAQTGVGTGSGSVSEFPFIVTKVEVANVDNNNSIIQDYGSSIYDYKTKYLKPRITVKPFRTSGTYTVYVKLYQNNVLCTGTGSPENYTFSNTVTLDSSSVQVFSLSGWGGNTAGKWSAGTYRFEIWYGDYCIGSKTFKVI